MKGAETREKIIDEAIDLFAKNGFHWVSFQNIASKVGVAQPTIYKYFNDRDDLYLGCLETIATAGRMVIDKGLDPYASVDLQLNSYLKGNMGWVKNHPHQANILFGAYYFALTNKAISESLLALNSKSIERVGILLAAGEREGLWKLGHHRKSCAEQIHSILIANMMKFALGEDDFSFTQRCKDLLESVRSIVQQQQ